MITRSVGVSRIWCDHLLNVLFPHLHNLAVDEVGEVAGCVVVRATPIASGAFCSNCGASSARVHSRYQRRLRDTPASGRSMELRLDVRRFFCDNNACAKVTFTEQVEGLTTPWSRRTPGLRSPLEAIGLALAGRAGMRLAGQIGVRVGRSSLLRLVPALPEPEVGTVPVLGVDDFAFRRGHTYGTILIDMATHRPIELLGSRDSAPLQAWLRAHPGVEVVCRDRSSSYADAIRAAAPDAVQVADRFHLWQNLTAAIETCIIRHRAGMDEPLLLPDKRVENEPPAAAEETDSDTVAEPHSRMAQRYRANHQTVHKLLAEGHSQRAIALCLGWGRHNVRKLARAERWQDLVVEPRARGSKLDDFKPYLHAEWESGRTNASNLYQEIRKMGFGGSYATLAAYLRHFRSGETTPARFTAPLAPSVREVTSWFTRHPDHLRETDRLQLKTLLTRCPPLDDVYELVKSFAVMMTEREGHRLPDWIDAALASGHPGLRRFGGGLLKDFDAVTAGLTLSHSSGAVEGNVNRLKMIKRKLYGRANLDLLRKLVLLSH